MSEGLHAVEGPWFELTAEDRADIARRHDNADRHDRQAPARDAAELAEYERIERDRQAAAGWEERDIHFHGRHSADQEIEHDDRCIYSCPYDTPQQAAWRAELATRAECEADREAGS
jgi:hypothetical protein